MKRIFSLLAAAGIMLGTVTGASAVDFKVSGQFEFGFEYARNMYNVDWAKQGSSEDGFSALQRLTVQFEAIANENLRGVYVARVGNVMWGYQGDGLGDGSGGGIGTQGVNVATRQAYLDWKPTANSSVQMGLQEIALPGAVSGSPVMDTRVAGITASYAFNKNVAASVFWYRPSNGGDGPGSPRFSKWDMFGLVLPLTFDGVSVTPWGVYSQMGRNATETDTFFTPGGWQDLGLAGQKIKPWWVGVALEVTAFDPFVFTMDAIYSGAKGDGARAAGFDRAAWDSQFADSDFDSRGWLVAAKLQYKMEHVTPGIIAWYGSGDEIENGKRKLRRLNTIEPSFQATSFGFDGSYSLTDRSCNVGLSPEGTWGVGLLAEDITYAENLTHHVRLMYYRGTNEYKEGVNYGGHMLAGLDGSLVPGNNLYLTDKDWALEVNLDTIYQIMENFSVALELGYMYLDCKDSGDYYRNASGEDFFEKNAYKVGLYFMYDF